MLNDLLPEYPIKDIARIIGASIPTTTKHIQRLVDSKHLMEKTVLINNRQTKVYSFNKTTLEDLKKLVHDNKQGVLNNKGSLNRGVLNVSNEDVPKDYDKLKADRDDFMEKYLNVKEELYRVQSDIKLLEDKASNKEAIYLKEINDLKSDRETEKSRADVLETMLNQRNKQLLVVGALLLVVVVIIACYFIFSGH